MKTVKLPDSDLVRKLEQRALPASINFELTARCNNNCRHCYINLPEHDEAARRRELSFAEIEDIADQALQCGALWCLLSGGEPLLRPDFNDIYLMLKKKGLLVSVFTNACLITESQVELFKAYRPRDLEVTVYGLSEETYERVSGVKGSYRRFRRGLELLLANGIAVSLKAIAIRSNVHELDQIAAFCAAHSSKPFRFDPFLHLRYDFDEKRNRMIRAERLSAEEVTRIELGNPERRKSLEKSCEKLILTERHSEDGRLFSCGVLQSGFEISYDGQLRLCGPLWHPDFVRDLRTMPLLRAYREIAAKVQQARSSNPEFITKCNNCNIINLCLFCPAHSYLETKKLDDPAEVFCKTAHARATALRELTG